MAIEQSCCSGVRVIFYRDLVEMEKEQLLKQNQQLTFDLEKARETIQSKNKEILKVRETFYPVCINFIHSPVFVLSIG